MINIQSFGKEKRRAYVGLSAPVFFDYGNQAKRTFNDKSTSPNAILENPYSLLLLYDEIWFLCPSLCPENMRNLDYVKFIDKDKNLRTRISKINKKINFMVPHYGFDENTLNDCYTKLVFDESCRVDTHTHGLKIFGDIFYSRPTYENYIFDLRVVYELREFNLEIITNSFTTQMISKIDRMVGLSKINQFELVDELIIKDIPNYLGPKGPYVPSAEEARNDPYLKDFRKWILNFNSDMNSSEIKELVAEVNNAIDQGARKSYLKELNKKNTFLSTAKTGLIFAVDTLMQLPLATILNEVVNIDKLLNNDDISYHGFIVSSKNYFNK